MPEMRPRLPDTMKPVLELIDLLGIEVALTLLDDEKKRREVTPIFEFEDGEDDDLPPLLLQGNKVLLLSDIHLPYHDIQAIRKALDGGKKMGIDTVYLNGDILDCYQVSAHQKDPAKRGIKYEIDLCKQFLQLVRHYFKDANIYYKFGNHEYRYERYIMHNAPQLADIPQIALDQLLCLNDYGINHVEHNRIAKFGKLNIAHGHEYRSVFGGGIHNARNARIKAGNHNIITGHFHRSQEDIAKDIDGAFVGSWVTGCLCKLNPAYAGKTQWNWGYALIERSGEMFEVHNKKIII